MAKHAVVRTDNMAGTDVRSMLVSVKYMGASGTEAKEIDNGNVVLFDKLMDGEREVYVGKDVTVKDPIEKVVLLASPEVMYDERLRNLNDYVNVAGKPIRGYRLHDGDIFSVTKEALAGVEAPVKGDIVELAAGTKLNVAKSATEGSTVVGEILDVDKTRQYTYYVILVNPVNAKAE